MDNGKLNQIVENIQSNSKLLARGRMTKTGIQNPRDVEILDMSSVSGIREYNPSEYTFTALSGTSLKEINQLLSGNNQFLPFDPPLAAQGATLGGTVAANLSGSMRYHYGGVRDFILGVNFLNSQGQLVRTGGKVVKNAAGFDIPKLMVGSLGSLGTMLEFSFKVFPRPKDYISLIGKYGNLPDALNTLIKLTSSSLEILCLELAPHGETFDIIVRLGGDPDLFQERISHILEELLEVKQVQGEEEVMMWETLNEFRWMPENTVLVKIPLIPKYIPKLEEFLKDSKAVRRYSAGGNVAWIAWPDPIATLDRKLKEFDLAGLSILGSADKVRLGTLGDNIFYQKIKAALDPPGLWVEV
jgi:glycolate oxidase FAD binding subunit